jgi:hypothetical protein
METYLLLCDVIGLHAVERLSSLRERSKLPRNNLPSKHLAFYETREGSGCFALDGKCRTHYVFPASRQNYKK